MSRPTIDLFGEDHAHEVFLKAMIGRLSGEEECKAVVRVLSARGGRGRVLGEFSLYQEAVARGSIPISDILVAAVDTNCASFHEAQRRLKEHLKPEFVGRAIYACPDPHIERWFMADPESFAKVIGAEPPRERRKCGRDRYKRQLLETICKCGHPAPLGGLEFARDLVLQMDLYRAGKNEPSLKAFIDGLRRALRLLAAGGTAEGAKNQT
jgi:hypothetical protein